MHRQNSGTSSLNITSQAYIPTSQSIYGGSTSANTTMLNVSHIRMNTADTDAMGQPQAFAKPPLGPSAQ